VDIRSARYVAAVKKFADVALEKGRDTYGNKRTPLFVDALKVETYEPFVWKHAGEQWILSNLASQQNLFRTLVGLTRLTGEDRYRQAAIDAVRYGFENLRSENGLLEWGGHVAYDAGADKLVMEGYRHELKRHYPYYELMRQVDAQATQQFLRAFWGAHILDWATLDFNRHGDYDKPIEAGLWGHAYRGGDVYFASRGRTFCNSGSDLIYAGAMLYLWGGEQGPLIWAERLADRYAATRNPKTGLAGYLFSFTGGIDKDRARLQFGPEFGDEALETAILDPGRAQIRYAMMGIVQLKLAEMLGEKGERFRNWALTDLKAYARHAYNVDTGCFEALFSNGKRIRPEDIKRDGYYFALQFVPWRPDGLFFWAYALAARMGEDDACWRMTREIAKRTVQHPSGKAVLGTDVSGRIFDVSHSLDLGDIGQVSGQGRKLNFETDCADAYVIFGLLELARKTGDQSLVKLAGRVGDNILDKNFRNGLFVREPTQVYGKFDELAPLALLQLAAVSRGRTNQVPDAWPGMSYFQCGYDGLGRTKDNLIIYGSE
jgi:pectate lyase